jgi:hypothetical protein
MVGLLENTSETVPRKAASQAAGARIAAIRKAI